MSVLDMQKQLRGLGLYYGRIDGINGPKTKQAIKKFQSIHPPLEVDGIAGKKTLAYLFPSQIKARGDAIRASNFHKYPLQSDIRSFYGRIGRNQTKLVLPYKMKLAWDLDVKISKFTCHKKVVEDLGSIFEQTLKHYGKDAIQELGLDLFGGCLNVRKMRGGSSYSTHSWGIAVDLDPARNQLKWGKDKANFANDEYLPFWKIVEDHGAVSLGREKNFDWMHFQFARL